ncbi:MAG: hypothetical protein ACRENV_05835 [Candidatus Dormibacteria bacterium]
MKAARRTAFAGGLAEVIGHAPALGLLRRQLAAGGLAHAYWVTGPPKVGKTTLALAASAELLAAEGWPGGLLSHPDLWLDDGETALGIDRIRTGDSAAEQGPTLQHFLSLSSFAGRGKAAVIGNAERLTLPAANSLLRLLEEPPPGSSLWLCTSRPDSEHLPATLRSRCQPLGLGPVDAAEIRDWLVRVHGHDPQTAATAAALGLGRPGLGLELAADPGLAARSDAQLDAWLACASAGPAAWLEFSRQLAERGTDRELAVAAVRVWASFLRDCCLRAVGAPQQCGWPAREGQAAAWAGALGAPGCARRYDLALDALARLGEAATPRLVLDRLLLLTFGDDQQPAAGPDRV